LANGNWQMANGNWAMGQLGAIAIVILNLVLFFVFLFVLSWKNLVLYFYPLSVIKVSPFSIET
jgi:hypothetical protein